MSELTEKIAREHKLNVLGECACGVFFGTTQAWHRHCLEVTEAAVRAGTTVAPSREDVATAVHAALAPWWMTIFPAIGGTQEAYEDLTSAIADTILALLPGRSETEVKAEALREAIKDIDYAGLGTYEANTVVSWLSTRADRIERDGDCG